MAKKPMSDNKVKGNFPGMGSFKETKKSKSTTASMDKPGGGSAFGKIGRGK